MDYKKPQDTLVHGGIGLYPLTTADQVILSDGSRLEKDGKINADKLDGRTLAEIMLAIYPVGAVYISANSTSPASLFGGTWEQVKGRLLIGTGANEKNTTETYGSLPANTVNRPLGEMGGEDKHALNISELARHTHYMVYGIGDEPFEKWTSLAAGVLDANEIRGRAAPNYIGGNAPHNNMPPYLAVNMWKRVG